jgi:hypothetical protein
MAMDFERALGEWSGEVHTNRRRTWKIADVYKLLCVLCLRSVFLVSPSFLATGDSAPPASEHAKISALSVVSEDTDAASAAAVAAAVSTTLQLDFVQVSTHRYRSIGLSL